MARDRDPQGYYSLLGVDASASADEIKRAYKARAQELHPDRNSAPNATQHFQSLNEAYRVLSDSESRAQYDAQSFDAAPSDEAQGRIDPVTCSACKKISAQPRYVICYDVVSLIFVSRKSATQGVFCSDCGSSALNRASLKTWLFGWWGIPWGPVWSLSALYQNLLGGELPPLNNFRLLTRQAIYFASINRVDLARAIAVDALIFERKIPANQKPSGSSTAELAEVAGQIIALASSASELPKVWGSHSKSFKFQGIAATVAIAVLLYAVSTVGGSRRTAVKHVPPARDASTPPTQAAEFDQPIVERPPTGRIASLWSKRPRRELAPLRIVTPTNGPNYYLKMVDLTDRRPRLVVFVRSGETASVEIPVGTYEFRYASGDTWYGEEYLFGPDTTYSRANEPLMFHIEGDRIIGHTITMIKQTTGNLRETSIAPTDF